MQTWALGVEIGTTEDEIKVAVQKLGWEAEQVSILRRPNSLDCMITLGNEQLNESSLLALHGGVSLVLKGKMVPLSLSSSVPAESDEEGEKNEPGLEPVKAWEVKGFPGFDFPSMSIHDRVSGESRFAGSSLHASLAPSSLHHGFNMSPPAPSKKIVSSNVGRTKIFVGGIQCSQEVFEHYFMSIEGCLRAEVVKSHGSRQSRGFGFVIFDSPATVEKVLSVKHWIGGRAVDCKIAIPRNELANGGGLGQKNSKLSNKTRGPMNKDGDSAMMEFLVSEEEFISRQVNQHLQSIQALQSRLSLIQALVVNRKMLRTKELPSQTAKAMTREQLLHQLMLLNVNPSA